MAGGGDIFRRAAGVVGRGVACLAGEDLEVQEARENTNKKAINPLFTHNLAFVLLFIMVYSNNSSAGKQRKNFCIYNQL